MHLCGWPEGLPLGQKHGEIFPSTEEEDVVKSRSISAAQRARLANFRGLRRLRFRDRRREPVVSFRRGARCLRMRTSLFAVRGGSQRTGRADGCTSVRISSLAKLALLDGWQGSSQLKGAKG